MALPIMICHCVPETVIPGPAGGPGPGRPGGPEQQPTSLVNSAQLQVKAWVLGPRFWAGYSVTDDPARKGPGGPSPPPATGAGPGPSPIGPPHGGTGSGPPAPGDAGPLGRCLDRSQLRVPVTRLEPGLGTETPGAPRTQLTGTELLSLFHM